MSVWVFVFVPLYCSIRWLCCMIALHFVNKFHGWKTLFGIHCDSAEWDGSFISRVYETLYYFPIRDSWLGRKLSCSKLFETFGRPSATLENGSNWSSPLPHNHYRSLWIDSHHIDSNDTYHGYCQPHFWPEASGASSFQCHSSCIQCVHYIIYTAHVRI